MAGQFNMFSVGVETMIDSSQMLPLRLEVTGDFGGAINSGAISANGLNGVVFTKTPVILEAWDTYRNSKVSATWKLIGFQVQTKPDFGLPVILNPSEFDVFFNEKLMMVNSANNYTGESVTVSVVNNTPQALTVGDSISSNIVISTEVTF